MDSIVNIKHSFFIGVVDKDLNFLLRNFILLNVLKDKLSSFIWRGIINVNNMIILVILHEY